MKSEKRAGSFLGRDDLEEGRGHWKDTLREGLEESLEGFLKVHKIEIFFGFDFEICIISLLVM